MKNLKTLKLSLIDGLEPETVIQVSGPVAGLQECEGGKHCAAHTSGPNYPCCRCGAEFRFRTQQEIDRGIK